MTRGEACRPLQTDLTTIKASLTRACQRHCLPTLFRSRPPGPRPLVYRRHRRHVLDPAASASIASEGVPSPLPPVPRPSSRIDALRLAWRPACAPLPHHFWDPDVAVAEDSAYSIATHSDPELEDLHRVGVPTRPGRPTARRLPQPLRHRGRSGFALDRPARRPPSCIAGHLIEAGMGPLPGDWSAKPARRGVPLRRLHRQRLRPARWPERGYCGHPEIELALIRLYRATNEPRYLELSQYFVDRARSTAVLVRPRGNPAQSTACQRRLLPTPRSARQDLRRYNQSHAPVREQFEVVGHAVRAMYLYPAMADLAGRYGRPGLRYTCERLWSHMVSTRLYITGGIGSSARNEGFSADFDLPTAKPMRRAAQRSGWCNGPAACSTSPLMATTPTCWNARSTTVSLAPSARDAESFLRQPAGQRRPDPSPAVVRSRVLSAQSSPPAGVAGRTCIHRATSTSPSTCSSAVRSPCRSLVDGFACVSSPTIRGTAACGSTSSSTARAVRRAGPGSRLEPRAATVHLNGVPVKRRGILDRGYLRLQQTWRSGDRLELVLPMPVERVTAHPAVSVNTDCVALQRGPIVYCLEQVDNDASLHTLILPRAAPVSASYDADCLGGVTKLYADGLANDTRRCGVVTCTAPGTLRGCCPIRWWRCRTRSGTTALRRDAGVDSRTEHRWRCLTPTGWPTAKLQHVWPRRGSPTATWRAALESRHRWCRT